MQYKLSTVAFAVMTGVLAGLAVGHLLFDDSARIRQLQAQIDEMNRDPQRVAAGSKRELRDSGAIASDSKSGDVRPPSVEDPLELTGEEAILEGELRDRERQGEFILDSERPFARRVNQQLVDRAVAAKATKDADEYFRVLTDLGLTPETAVNCVSHLSKIHKAAIEAELAIRQLQQARVQFEDRLKTGLGDEGFRRYQEYEASRPAEREYELLRTYLAEANIRPDQFDPAILKRFIQETQAYTEKPWMGPFDGMPEPAFGEKMVTAQIQNEIERVNNRAAELLRRVSEAGLPETYQNALAGYYANFVERRRQEIVTMRQRMGTLEHPRRPERVSDPRRE